jgi:ribonuclease E
MGEEDRSGGEAAPESAVEDEGHEADDDGEGEPFQAEGGEDRDGERGGRRRRGRRGGRRRRRDNGHEEGQTFDEAAPPALPMIDGQPVEHVTEHRMPVEQAPFEAAPTVALEVPPPPPAPEPPIVAAAPQPVPLPAPEPPPPVVPVVPVIEAPPANPKRGWWRR